MKHLLTMLVAGCIFSATHAQEAKPVTVKEFIEVVLDHPDVHASAAKIRDADYDLQVAKFSPAPALTVGNVSGDISGIDMPQQFYVGVDYTVEAGGKRKHRIAYAKAGKEVLIAEHNVYVAHFLREALLTYQKCWMMEQQYREMADFEKLITKGITDSVSLEMLRIQHSLRRMELESAYTHALSEFRMLTDHRFEDTQVTPCEPVWDYRQQPGQGAPENEPTLQLVRAERKHKEEEIQLQAAELVGDVSFTLGNNFITEATHPEAPSPNYNAITATVTIPLKFNLKSRPRRNNVVVSNNSSDEEQEHLEMIKKRYAAVQSENQRLVLQLRQIETLITLERTQIEKCVDGDDLVEEIRELESLQQMRWEKMMQISANLATIHATQYQSKSYQITSNR